MKKKINIKKKKKFILIGSKEVDLEVDVEKNKVRMEFMSFKKNKGE
jgi:hypothetical protein